MESVMSFEANPYRRVKHLLVPMHHCTNQRNRDCWRSLVGCLYGCQKCSRTDGRGGDSVNIATIFIDREIYLRRVESAYILSIFVSFEPIDYFCPKPGVSYCSNTE